MRVSLFFLYIIVGTVSFSAYSEEKPCQSKDVAQTLQTLGCEKLVSYSRCCNNPQGTGCLEKFRRPGGGKICLRHKPFAGQRIFNKWNIRTPKLPIFFVK